MKPPAYFLAFALLWYSELSLACKPSVNQPLTIETEEQKFGGSDLVFLGRVIATRKAPEFEKQTQHPYTFVVTIAVEKWLKGSGGQSLEVIDTSGDDCEPSMGLFHIVNHPNPRSTRWRVFVRSSQGHLMVTTAESIK